MKHIAGMMALAAVLAGGGAASGDDALPTARTFNVGGGDGGQVVRGFALESGSEAYRYRIGIAVVCLPSSGEIAAHLFFGPFPTGRPVQTTVRSADGGVSRFGGAAISDHGELAGFHSPVLTDRVDVVSFVAKVFAPGAVIGNGHIAFRNGIPAADNEEATSALLDCAGR